MRPRSYLGLILALGLIVAAGALATANRGLAGLPVRVGPDVHLPLEVAALGVFLLGFLPPAIALSVSVASRRLAARRFDRERVRAEERHLALDHVRDLLADGRWRSAARELEAVPEPDAEVLLLAGAAERGRARPADALERDRRAVEAAPGRVAPRYAVMQDQRLLADEEAARRTGEEIRERLDGFGLAVLRELQDEALRGGDLERAEALGAEIDAFDEDADDVRAAGLAWHRARDESARGEAGAARRRLRRLVEERPDHVAAWRSLGELEAGSDPEAALGTWRAGFEATGSEVLLERIAGLEGAEDRAAAVLSCLRRSAPTPEIFDRWEARIALRRDGTLPGDGDDPVLAAALGRRALESDDRAAALEHWSRALELAGLDHEAWVCGDCGAAASRWEVRCARCDAWNAIEPAPVAEETAR